MAKENFLKILSYTIATVWIINGLICKLLNLVPRHQEIVARILGNEYAFIFTKLIGVSEIMMGVWVMSRIKSRLNTILQIVIVATMNILEFILAPDLLLWGKFNSLFALMFILIICYTEFKLKQTTLKQG